MDDTKLVVIGAVATGLALKEMLTDEAVGADIDLHNLQAPSIMDAEILRAIRFEKPVNLGNWKHLERPDNGHPSNPRKRR